MRPLVLSAVNALSADGEHLVDIEHISHGGRKNVTPEISRRISRIGASMRVYSKRRMALFSRARATRSEGRNGKEHSSQTAPLCTNSPAAAERQPNRPTPARPPGRHRSRSPTRAPPIGRSLTASNPPKYQRRPLESGVGDKCSREPPTNQNQQQMLADGRRGLTRLSPSTTTTTMRREQRGTQLGDDDT